MQNFQDAFETQAIIFHYFFNLHDCTFKASISLVLFFFKKHLLNACEIKEFWPFSLQPAKLYYILLVFLS